MSTTRKPCNGCRDTHWREDGELCRSCQSLLEDGHKWRASLVADANIKRFRMSKVWRGCSGISEAFSTLWPLIFPTADIHVPHGGALVVAGKSANSEYGYGRYVAMTEDQARAIIALSNAVVDGLQAEYQRGVNDGRDLLRQLAAGQISAADINAGQSADLIRRRMFRDDQ